jgi:hypothetical protein
MYRHCIYCSADLRANEAVEAFPVGRTLAFDAAKGRLWAVCAKCARWNLAPLEERWEAVETAERLFVDAKLRVQRENIGMARLRDGTRLVRVGRAERRELAAWRYGDEMRRRNELSMRTSSGELLAYIGGAALMIATGSLALPAYLALHVGRPLVLALQRQRPVHRIASTEHGAGIRVIRRKHLDNAWLRHDGEGLVLALPTASANRRQVPRLRGDDARRVVEKAMLLVNRSGAPSRQVDLAVDAIAATGGGDAYVRRLLAEGRVLIAASERAFVYGSMTADEGPADGPSIRGPEALALEMALHEEQERRALEGELVLLESAWREAEAIAAIADRLAMDAPAPAE